MRKRAIKKTKLKDIEQKCLECEKEVVYTCGVLNRHLMKEHNMEIQAYYMKNVDNSLCACGCGGTPAWQPRGGYTKEYVNGHNYRGKTKENDKSVARRAAKMVQHENWKRSIWKKGNVPWNDGLNKENNEIMKQISEKMSGENHHFFGKTKEDCDALKRMSETNKKLWASGRRSSPFMRVTKEQRKGWVKRATITRNKNGYNLFGYKSGFYISNSNKKYFYYSSWELERMKYYDNCKNIESWGRCKDMIPYYSSIENKSRLYNPDFEICFKDNNIVIEEIKGQFSQKTIDKAIAAKDFYRNKKKYITLTKCKHKANFHEVSIDEMKEIIL